MNQQEGAQEDYKEEDDTSLNAANCQVVLRDADQAKARIYMLIVREGFLSGVPPKELDNLCVLGLHFVLAYHRMKQSGGNHPTVEIIHTCKQSRGSGGVSNLSTAKSK